MRTPDHDSEDEFWSRVTPLDQLLLDSLDLKETSLNRESPDSWSRVSPPSSQPVSPTPSRNNVPRFTSNGSQAAMAVTPTPLARSKSAKEGSEVKPNRAVLGSSLSESAVGVSQLSPRYASSHGFSLYPSLREEFELQVPEPTPLFVAPLPASHATASQSSSASPGPESSHFNDGPGSPGVGDQFETSQFDEIISDSVDSLPIEEIVSCPVIESLDNADIAFGIQYELARGVQLRRWSWDDLSPERLHRLRGSHAEVMPRLNDIMGSGITEAVHKIPALWEEYDREQAAIVEGEGRGLGVNPATFYGFDNWYGGRIQQVVRLVVSPDGPRPYTLRLEPPEMKRSFRIARLVGSRRILIVKTSPPPADDGRPKRWSQRPHPDSLSRRFVLLGRIYVPFDAKDGHVYMVEINEDIGRTPREEQGDFHRMSFQEFIRLNNPISLNSQQPISKWATRFDLGTSTTVPALEFAHENMFLIEDIVAEGCDPNGKVSAEQCMTDGGGFLNGAAASLIAKRIHLTERPTAIQGRIAGSKGVWVIHPEDRDATAPPRIWVRRSQHKIVFPDLAHPSARCHRIFDLVQPSRVSTPARLSMQLIMNMSHNGVPDGAFSGLLNANLREESTAFMDWTKPHAITLLWAAVARAGNIPAIRLQRTLPAGVARAAGLASRFDMERAAEGAAADVYPESESQTEVMEMDPAFKFAVPKEEGRSGPESLYESVMELLEAGFRPQDSPYVYEKLRYVLNLVIQGVVSKYRIPVPRSAEAYVIADPVGVLEEGQIHFRSSVELGDPLVDDNPYIVTGDVLICRHPTRLKSDVRKVQAIRHPALAAYTDVVIVPIKGSRSLMSELSGGDLDGDTAWITWEPSLVEPFVNAPLVLPTPDFIEENFERDSERLFDFCQRLEHDPSQFTRELVKALLGGISDRKVGLYSKFHDLSCWKRGYDHPDSERLAHMFTTCLDGNKTGLRARLEIFRTDSRQWDIQNVPACFRDTKENQYVASPAKREVRGPFVLETLREAGHDLGTKLLSSYHSLRPQNKFDGDLLAPYASASSFAALMRREHKLSAWELELRALRVFVEKRRADWPSAASPKKGRTANKRDNSIKSLAVRFERDAPEMQYFALSNAVELRASAAYENCREHGSSEDFAFAMAFKDLCVLKAKARGDARPVTREIGDMLTIARSTRKALGGT